MSPPYDGTSDVCVQERSRESARERESGREKAKIGDKHAQSESGCESMCGCVHVFPFLLARLMRV